MRDVWDALPGGSILVVGQRVFVRRADLFAQWWEMRLFASCRPFPSCYFPTLAGVLRLQSAYMYVYVCRSSYGLMSDQPLSTSNARLRPAQRVADRLGRVVSPAGRVGLRSTVLQHSNRAETECHVLKERAICRQEIWAVELGRDARWWRRTGPDWRRRARSCRLFVRFQSLEVRRDVRVSAGLVCMLGKRGSM